MKCTLLLLWTILLMAFNHIQAQTPQKIYVNIASTAASPDGSSWENAFTDFQAGINAAAFGDTVFVAKGTYQPASNTSFNMTDGIKIYGGFVGNESNLAQRNLSLGDTSKLMGNGTSVIINNGISSDALLDGFAITGGRSTGGDASGGTFPSGGNAYGGGIQNYNSSPTFMNIQFYANIAIGGNGYNGTITFGGNGYGGAVYNNNASPTFINTLFYANKAVGGNADGGTITSGGQGNGGAMYNDNSSPTFINVKFYADTAVGGNGYNANIASGGSGYGGSVYNSYSTSIFTNVQFYNNAAKGGHQNGFGNNGNDYGGVLYNDYSSSTILTNSLFYNNSSSNGAVIYNYASVNLTNCSFSGNTGLSDVIHNSTNSTTIITNCILWDNITEIGNDIVYTDPSDPFYDPSYVSGTVTVTYSIVAGGYDGTGNSSSDPQYADAANGNYQLQSSSPAINIGIPDTSGLNIPAADLASKPRVVAGKIDLGAFENQFSIVLAATLLDFTGNLKTGIATLQWKTGMEKNTDHFEAEKSVDAVSFSPIAIQAETNSSLYSINKPQLEPKAYYRLKIVDINGAITYSKVVLLTQTAIAQISVYPNPTTAIVYVEGNAAELQQVHLINISGQDITGNVLISGVGSNKLQMNMGNLASGIYFIKTTADVFKIIKR